MRLVRDARIGLPCSRDYIRLIATPLFPTPVLSRPSEKFLVEPSRKFLSSRDAQRGYRHAIDEFIEWYCSEPRLPFSRTVVVRYRMHLESRKLALGTVNLRLGAVRRLAYEATIAVSCLR